MKVKPCCGAGDVPGMPCVLPRVHSFSPHKLPSCPPNADSYSAELGDTGERSWWLHLILPSAEGKEKEGVDNPQNPLHGLPHKHQHT